MPKRVLGEFAITSRFAEFFVNGSKPFSTPLLRDLNNFDFAPNGELHTIPQAVRTLFNSEKDFFQDDHNRGWKTRRGLWHEKLNLSGFNFVQSRYDQHFLPTLVDTDLFDVEKWPNYPVSKGFLGRKKTSEPEKHFFLMITPHRNWTLIMLNYPVSSIFGPKGQVLSTEISISWVLWILKSLAFLIQKNGNFEEPTQEQLEVRHRYWDLVGRIDPLRKEYESKEKGTENLPVVPFHDAVVHIEGDMPKFDWQTQTIEGQRQVCWRCGDWVTAGKTKCDKCGALVS